MSEFDEKLNALLSNPDSMAQIMQMARALSGELGDTPADGGTNDNPTDHIDGGSAPNGSAPNGSAPTGDTGGNSSGSSAGSNPFNSSGGNTRGPSGNAGLGGLGGLGDLFSGMGNLDPKLIAKLLPLLQEFRSGSDDNARQLLLALRPYLKTERQEKVERALQLARLIHLGKKFLMNWEG